MRFPPATHLVALCTSAEQAEAALARLADLLAELGLQPKAAKRIRRQIRSWRLHLRSGSTLGDLAQAINPIVRGWIN